MSALKPGEVEVLQRLARGDDIDTIVKHRDAAAGAAIRSFVRELFGGNVTPDQAAKLLRLNGHPTTTLAGRQPTPPPEPSGYEALLDEAEKHPMPRIRELALKARQRLDALQDILDEDKRATTARVRVAELEAQLAAARAELPGGARHARAAGEAPSADVRRWAADNNVACPIYGRVPATVRKAYDAAMAKGDQR